MRLWHWLVLATLLLFPLEAHATIAYVKILAMDSDFRGNCGGAFDPCGFGTIDYSVRGDGGLDQYDFQSERFSSSGFAHNILPTGNPLFTGPDFMSSANLFDYLLAHPGSHPLSYLEEIDPFYLLRVIGPFDAWGDALTTDFSPGTVGFWSTSHTDDVFDEVHIDFLVLPGPPVPVPEPGSLILLLSALGLWFGFQRIQARGLSKIGR